MTHTKLHYLLVVFIGFLIAACDRSKDLYWPENEWETASPESYQMDSVGLATLVQSIRNGNYGHIKSLLIVKNGYMITEEYFNSADTFTLQSVYSITKSLLGSVWGIAEKNGDVPPIDTPIEAALPEYASLITTDSLKRQISIRDLLTMTSGIEWIENDLREGHATNDFFELMSSPDQVAYVLNRPMIDIPGKTFNYNSGCSIILSAILTANSGKKFGEYVNTHLLSRIGIDSTYCIETPQLSNAASGLYLTSREMAKFGLLIARKGRWGGDQIIPYDWIQQSTSSIISLYGNPLFTGYGYHWWNTTQWLSVGIRDSITTHMAIGWGGQMIVAVPKYDLVIVITAAQSHDERETMDPIFIVWHHILPAIRLDSTVQ